MKKDINVTSDKPSVPRYLFLMVALVCIFSTVGSIFSGYRYVEAALNGVSDGSAEFYRTNALTVLVFTLASCVLLFVLIIENKNHKNTMSIVRRLNWSMERLSDRSTAELNPSKISEARWPWGSHHTELLGHLEAAANRWWALYDSSDPSTAPKNEWVVDWLKEQGVSNTKAEAIASILRADGLKTGPR